MDALVWWVCVPLITAFQPVWILTGCQGEDPLLKDARLHRKEDGFSWSNRHESVLKRDLGVLLHPLDSFFFAPAAACVARIWVASIIQVA